MKSKLTRRIACIGLTAVMAATLAAGNALAFAKSNKTGSVSASRKYDTVKAEDVTGKVDLTGVAVQHLSPQVIENAGYTTKNSLQTVIITLDGECVLDRKPDDMSASEYVSSYQGSKFVKSVDYAQTNLLNKLSSLGISYKEVYRYSTVTNAVAVEMNTADMSKLKGVAHIKGASVAERYDYPKTTAADLASVTENPNNVYPTGIYDSSKYLSQYDGSGMTVAILDTGLDYTHKAFSTMPATLGMTKSDVAGKLTEFESYSLSKAKGKTLTANDLYLNDKVPYAYDYADKDSDVYPSYSQHGTHVAGIVSGQADEYTDKDGNTATDDKGNKIPFRGVAPGAQLVICKVFTDDFESKDLGGATTEDILAALEDCVTLGVDVINMSLGTSAGFSSISIDGDTEGEQLNTVYRSIKNAGINLICAASNDYSSGFGSAFGTNLATNPDSGTVGSPSTFDGAMSVASINGQRSPFMMANGKSAIFYRESSDENAVQQDFLKQLIYDEDSGAYNTETFKYVVVPGTGQAADYTNTILSELKDKSQGRTIAVIRRGNTTFKEKIETLMDLGRDENGNYVGADAVIVYNNVAGTVGMNLGEVNDPIPAVSVTLDAGRALIYDDNGARRTTGTIELNYSYQAGPFMNDYSSWGSTPDLKLKPDITSHGGEITSTVAGGYNEQSGTSMASPNLAGVAALLRGKLKQDYPAYSNVQLTTLTNQILMSTSETVYDENGLPYSPRKQGAGLATLDNIFTTGAYLWTDSAEDNRPKIELGEDKQKTGEYTLNFHVRNFGTKSLEFTAKSIFMTETLSSDGLAVAEKAHLLTDVAAQWKVGGSAISEGDTIRVNGGEDVTVTVVLKLSDAEKRYIDTNFTNGMFIEGFIKLESKTGGQCSLNLPFMGFYGDWYAAEMLDYDCYEISEFEQDTNYNDETRPQASVWATQAYSTYFNEKYTVPLGSFMYAQDEDADQIYVDKEHAAISRYNVYNGPDSTTNYMTARYIKALYAGLLRNAELVTYDLYDAETGEIIKRDNVYRVNKAYSRGGSPVPAQVLLELDPDELGLVNNGKYAMDFRFYFRAEDADDPAKQNDENTFSMIFYVDYEAPVLADSRIRYYDYKENNRDKQRVYLDLDIYDNVYSQSVILCYSDGGVGEDLELKLATEYITPIYNSNKNGTTTVSIEITDFYEKYNHRLYVQVEDYALNHRVYNISFIESTSSSLPTQFEIDGEDEITIGVNQTYKVKLKYEGEANLSNFSWYSTDRRVLSVKNGEIFAKAVGTGTVTVSANGVSRRIKVNVVESNTTLPRPTISFSTIEDANNTLVKAAGSVDVNAGANFKLEIICDPWYYPVENLKLQWNTTDPLIASVDQNGNVKTLDKKGSAYVSASIIENGIETSSTGVMLNVQEPFTISNYTLVDYHGTGGRVVVPDDKNITTIGEEAFKDNDNITSIIIPKTVTQISERAFVNCTALEEVYFISEQKKEPADADLSLILKHAFIGCSKLKKVDLSNCKVITVDKEAFYGCEALEEVVDIEKIGTVNDRAFYGCKSLKEADLTGLHTSGTAVFENCTSLASITTGIYTDIGARMFAGCTSLESATIKCSRISDSAFEGCTKLKRLEVGGTGGAASYEIGARAFYGCTGLDSVTFNAPVTSIGDYAFANCNSLTSVAIPAGLANFGNSVFQNTSVTLTTESGSEYTIEADGTIYSGTMLVLAPKTVNSSYTIKAGTTEIAPYAFSGCTIESLTIPDSVTKIGEGAFASSNITAITLPANITEISDNLFNNSTLKQIEISAKIVIIGNNAFSGCGSLANVTFAENSALKVIGDNAFSGTALTQITLPDGASMMGGKVFENCKQLTNVTLPSVEILGLETFLGCSSLEEVTFGSNAKTTGSRTFMDCTALTQVTLGDSLNVIASGAFYGCTSLTSVDLKGATAIGAGAFCNCTALQTVTGLDKVQIIDTLAFYKTAITELKLDNAEIIGNYAFADGKFTSLSIPKATFIGSFAFYGGLESSVSLSSELSIIGDGAFANSGNLTSIEVEDNLWFFSEDGVLYRSIIGATERKYELVAYPSAKVGTYKDDVRAYTVKEGTVSIGAYSFAHLKSGTLQKVFIPYSVKTIGASAFFASGITQYQFESIQAPVLLTEFVLLGDNPQYFLFYANFGDELVNHIEYFEPTTTPSNVKIYYPTNGTGYNNYVYTNYFGSKAELGELMDDVTRSLIKTLDSFYTLEEINGWNSLDTKNENNRNMVIEFSQKVINAHAVYDTLASDKQVEYFGADNIKKLSDTEAALKTVKAKFGIAAKVTSLSVNGDSTHKTEYKVGEKFDITGLKLIVNYDDRTSEVADMSRITLSEEYSGELTEYDKYVELEGYGVKIKVAITVTADGVNGGDGEEEGGGEKSNVGLIVGLTVGGVCLLGAAAAVTVVLLLRKKRASSAKEDVADNKESDENQED